MNTILILLILLVIIIIVCLYMKYCETNKLKENLTVSVSKHPHSKDHHGHPHGHHHGHPHGHGPLRSLPKGKMSHSMTHLDSCQQQAMCGDGSGLHDFNNSSRGQEYQTQLQNNNCINDKCHQSMMNFLGNIFKHFPSADKLPHITHTLQVTPSHKAHSPNAAHAATVAASHHNGGHQPTPAHSTPSSVNSNNSLAAPANSGLNGSPLSFVTAGPFNGVPFSGTPKSSNAPMTNLVKKPGPPPTKSRSDNMSTIERNALSNIF